MDKIKCNLLIKRDKFTESILDIISKSETLELGEVHSQITDDVRLLEERTLLILDFGLIEENEGLRLISRIKQSAEDIKIIVILNEEKDTSVHNLICTGAFYYFVRGESNGYMLNKLEEVIKSKTPIGSLITNKLRQFMENMSRSGSKYNLSLREKEILNQLIGGLTKKKIAENLSLSFHTIDKHIRNIYKKLEVNSRSEAISKTLRENIIII